MTIEELDAELRPYGWHAWQSDGTRAWLHGRLTELSPPLRYASRFYAARCGTTEWADSVGGLRDAMAGRLAALGARKATTVYLPVNGGTA